MSYVHILIIAKKEKSSAEDSGMGSKEQTDDTELSCISKTGLENHAQSRVQEKAKPSEKSIASPGGNSSHSNVLSDVQNTGGKNESRAASEIGTIYFKNV